MSHSRGRKQSIGMDNKTSQAGSVPVSNADGKRHCWDRRILLLVKQACVRGIQLQLPTFPAWYFLSSFYNCGMHEGRGQCNRTLQSEYRDMSKHCVLQGWREIGALWNPIPLLNHSLGGMEVTMKGSQVSSSYDYFTIPQITEVLERKWKGGRMVGSSG